MDSTTFRTTPSSAPAADGLIDPVVFALRQSALGLFAAIVARDTDAMRAAVREEPRLVKTAAKFRGQEAYAVEVAAMMDVGSAVDLLAAGADLNVGVSSTPVYTAVARRSYGALRALLAHKADPNMPSPGSSDMPLHCAVRLRDAAMMRMLLAAGASPSKLSHAGESPLHIACSLGRADLVSMLIAAGADVNVIGGQSPLLIAARSGVLEIVRILIEAGADPNLDKGPSALSMSIGGDFAISKFLLDHGADPNCSKSKAEPLLLALLHGHKQLVRLLFERGADPNLRVYNDLPHIWDSIPHRLAANPIEADTFLEFDPKIDILNSAGRTPLMTAVAHGHESFARALLERGADVNHISHNCQRLTALHTALFAGYPRLVTLLLDWGADPRVSEEGWPSVLELVRTSHAKFAPLVLRKCEKLL